MDRLRIVIVDDEPLLRSGLRLMLEGDEFSVCGEASNGKDAIAIISQERPDVVLMDIRMPVMSGIEAIGKISNIPVIMLTSFDTEEFVLDALKAGAVGFLLKTTPPEALVAAITAAARGQQILSPAAVERLLSAEKKLPRTRLGLSERELEVAELVAQGLSNSEISERLFISLTTVKSHVKSILGKIGGTSRVHIVIAVLETR